MNPEYIVFCVAIITLIVYLYLTAYSPSLIYVRSTEDNKLHLVQNKPDKVDAANLFAEIKRRNRELVKKFVEKFGDKDGRVNTLAKRYKDENIREAVPKVNQTSYSLNKGEKIVICVRSKDSKNELTDINTVMFVVLHELAHLMTLSVGHNDEFWENFRFILAHAIEWKLYTVENYEKKPKPYCGIKITESPLETKDIPKYIVSKETRESFTQF